MRTKNTVDILKEEIQIPRIVQEKAETAFAQIKAEADCMEQTGALCGEHTDHTGEKSANKRHRKFSGFFAGRKMWQAAGAAALALTVFGAGAAAAYMQWSKGLEDGLQTTGEQRQMLEDNQMASFVGQSVTQGGVTITAQQSIVDKHFAYLSFKVEGYEIEEGAEPGFSGISIVVDGGESYGGWSGGFYTGRIDKNGRAHHADGTPLQEDEQVSYMMEDGSLEYQVLMQCDEEGALIGKPIHVELKDLGTYTGPAEHIAVDTSGTWSFDWALQGGDEVRTCKLDALLEESGATVLQAEISPISISVQYDMPRREETEMARDENNGTEAMRTVYAEPPYFSGVRLKDGTMYTGLAGAGFMGYQDESSDTYECTFALMRVLDVDQIESLLFIKSYPQGEQPLTEENLYVVPVA